MSSATCTSSQDFADACAFVGDVARPFAGHEGVYCVEWANEPDHDHYAFNYWLPKYPDYATRLARYSAWVKSALDLSGQLAGEGHAVITMGHALIGAMFCVETYHWSDVNARYIADTWNFTRNNKDYLKVPNDPCPVPSAHMYWFGAPVSDFTSDYITPFTAYCKGRAVTVLVGEHGDLRTAAAWYVRDIEDVMAKAGLDSCAMRLAPRVGFPLADEPVITEPQEDAPETGEPNDPSSSVSEPSGPGQETTSESSEEPSEPSIPTTEGEEPSTEPSIIEEPDSGDPGESETEAPEETVPEISEPSTIEPGIPTPGTGWSVLLELIRWILTLFKRK